MASSQAGSRQLMRSQTPDGKRQAELLADAGKPRHLRLAQAADVFRQPKPTSMRRHTMRLWA